MMMRERLVWKRTAIPLPPSPLPERFRIQKKEEKQKLNSMNRTQKTPDYSRFFLEGLVHYTSVEGLNDYANLPT